MLREIADLQLDERLISPGDGVEAAGQELGEGRLAVAVGAEQGDAVVGIDAQVDAAQHRRARRIADIDVVEGQ